jgi:hypothetical protein
MVRMRVFEIVEAPQVSSSLDYLRLARVVSGKQPPFRQSPIFGCPGHNVLLLTECLWPWMKFPMHFAQPVARDMRVNFRRADARMAQQFLNHPQIRAVLQ